MPNSNDVIQFAKDSGEFRNPKSKWTNGGQCGEDIPIILRVQMTFPEENEGWWGLWSFMEPWGDWVV